MMKLAMAVGRRAAGVRGRQLTPTQAMNLAGAVAAMARPMPIPATCRAVAAAAIVKPGQPTPTRVTNRGEAVAMLGRRMPIRVMRQGRGVAPGQISSGQA
jgi:hypothetical protein